MANIDMTKFLKLKEEADKAERKMWKTKKAEDVEAFKKAFFEMGAERRRLEKLGVNPRNFDSGPDPRILEREKRIEKEMEEY